MQSTFFGYMICFINRLFESDNFDSRERNYFIYHILLDLISKFFLEIIPAHLMKSTAIEIFFQMMLVYFRNRCREWITAIAKVMAGTGSDWIKEHHHDSFAPVRRESRVQWYMQLYHRFCIT